ncbi:MAG TPA: lytic transglycosylase domain-containing protein [Ktedonobacteraceae bacterium]|jgi:soluble lytic murein transglycosylase-like protein
MQDITDIQPAVHTDIRNSKKQSRIRMALAGSGIAGALLLSGLLGSHAGHPASQSHAHMAKANVVVSHVASSAHMRTAPVSYTIANDYVGMAQQAAIAAGIDPGAFVRQIQQESGFNPNAGSPAGAEGIAQFMPGTAASMGVNPYDPSSALPGAARLMAGLAAQFGGNYSKALAAYNAGPGAVQSAVAQGGGNWLSYMPAETQNYVSIIMG